jgi:uncharacterized protein DUF4233
MRSFVGIMSGTLMLEVIVVLLAMPVLAKLGEGLATWQGVLVGGLAFALLVTCAVVRRPWGVGLAVALQLVMIACWFAVPALGILGLVFGLVWAGLLWMRWDVSRRMAQGRLPSQSPRPHAD